MILNVRSFTANTLVLSHLFNENSIYILPQFLLSMIYFLLVIVSSVCHVKKKVVEEINTIVAGCFRCVAPPDPV